MILINCNRQGFVEEIINSDNYQEITDIIDSLTEEYEARGIMLISDIANNSLTRTLEFSSVENGWECALILAHGYIKNVSPIEGDEKI